MVSDNTEYYYLVQATDTSNNNSDNNLVKLADTVQGSVQNGTWSAGAELGDNGFNETSRHVGWEQSSTRKHTGNRSYYSQNNSGTCNDLTSDTIRLTANETSELSFWTAYDIENRWDGGVVEISTDNENWNALGLNYPQTFRVSQDACNYAENTPSFSGTNLTWTQHTLDISQYQGQEIKVRWNYSTDGAENKEGWFLDDITISNAQTPSQCNAISDDIFTGAFE